MPHKYLRFSDSSYGGKCVGTGTSELGNALTDPTVTTIQIPRTFASKNVVEIGKKAFWDTNIINVFIPSTVLYISANAFYYCVSLKEVRFEKGSKLKKLDKGAIAY